MFCKLRAALADRRSAGKSHASRNDLDRCGSRSPVRPTCPSRLPTTVLWPWDFGEDSSSSREVLELPIEGGAGRAEARLTRIVCRRRAREEIAALGPCPAGGAGPSRRGDRHISGMGTRTRGRTRGMDGGSWKWPRQMGDPRLIEEALRPGRTSFAPAIGPVGARSSRSGRSVLLNRQHEGHDLDIVRCSTPASRCAPDASPDPRVFPLLDIEAIAISRRCCCRSFGIDPNRLASASRRYILISSNCRCRRPKRWSITAIP